MFRHSTENKAPCHFPSFFSESNTKSNAKHYIVTSSTTCTIRQICIQNRRRRSGSDVATPHTTRKSLLQNRNPLRSEKFNLKHLNT